MTTLSLDFETHSAIDLVKTGVYVYAEHDSTDVWCAGYAFDDGPVELWTVGEPCPEEIEQHVAAGGEIAAWNANFERLIWKQILGPKHGWPIPKDNQYRCVMVQGMAMALPGSLERASAALGLDNQKDMTGHRLMLQMASPRRIEGDKYIWWDDAPRLKRLYEYCPQDVRAQRDADKRLVKLPKIEREIYLLDQKINDRGVKVDVRLCHQARKIIETQTAKLDAEMAIVTDREVTECSQVQRLVKWLKECGVDTSSVDKEHITDLLGEDLPGDDFETQPVRRALELRQEAAKGSNAKIESLLNGMCADGRIRGLLQYHAASTGRWAGRRFQPQNLPRPDLKIGKAEIDMLMSGSAELIDMAYGKPLSFVSDCIRSLLVAETGHDLVTGDFKNIEGRVLAWLAGQTDKVGLFAANAPIYERMAGAIYGVDPDQIVKGTKEYQLGKQSELGCGFGMGTPKFMTTCKKNNIPIDFILADTAVTTWRELNSEIVKFWYDLERACIEAVEHKGAITHCGRIRYRVNGSFLWCALPSGRNLCYCYPKIIDKVWVAKKNGDKTTMKYDLALEQEKEGKLKIESDPQKAVAYKGVNSYTKKWQDLDTYGGKLVENVTQAVARDLLAEAMLRVEKAAYPVILTVHDEIVSEVASSFGSLDEFEQIMSAVPDWARGCPIGVEGWRGERYRK